MPETSELLIAFVMIALIVYATRLGGYLVGLQIRHIGWLRPVLEALPGCAFMAILVPAVRRGNIVEFAAMICVVGIMWRSNNVVIATVVGMLVLIFGDWAIVSIQ